MPINVDDQRKAWMAQKGGEWWVVPEGDTGTYVCPPCHDADTVACYAIKLHFSISDDCKMAPCLDLASNPILTCDVIQQYLTADVTGGCPVCEGIASGHIRDPERVKRMLGQDKWIWNLIPIKFRAAPTLSWQQFDPVQVVQLISNYTTWDGINEAFHNEGDITRFDRVILMMINRVGKDRKSKYKVGPESETLKQPLDISKTALIDMMRQAFAPGGPGNIYRRVALMVRSRAELQAQLALGGGVEMAGGQQPDVATVAAALPTTIVLPPAQLPMTGLPPATGGGAPAVALPGVAPSAAPAAAPATTPFDDVASTTVEEVPAEVTDAAADDQAPPCYKLDCAPTDPECQACKFLTACADECGLELPKEAEAESVEAEAPAMTLAAAKDIPPGGSCVLSDEREAKAIGTAKGRVYFELADGTKIKLAPDDQVAVPAAPEVESGGALGQLDVALGKQAAKKKVVRKAQPAGAKKKVTKKGTDSK